MGDTLESGDLRVDIKETKDMGVRMERGVRLAGLIHAACMRGSENWCR